MNKCSRDVYDASVKQFELNQAIDACDVNLDLLRQIEQELADEIEGATILTLSGKPEASTKPAPPGSPARKRKTSKRVYSSAAEYERSDFENGVSSIVLERKREDSDNYARLSLSDSPDKKESQLLVSLQGADVNRQGEKLAQSVGALLKERRATTYFIHTVFAYPLVILFAVVPLAYLARNIISGFSALDVSFSLAGAALYCFLTVFMIRQFVPFCVFDTEENRRAKKISGYVAGTVAALFLFLVLAGLL